LRPEDHGQLWEHLVLEFLQARVHDRRIQYWRDASGREVDFVIPRGRDEIDAIECKWDPAEFDATALRLFRTYYPRGRNYVISPISGPGYPKRAGGLEVLVSSPEGWKG
jgi:predicted AAA+ superfamily ATPase